MRQTTTDSDNSPCSPIKVSGVWHSWLNMVRVPPRIRRCQVATSKAILSSIPTLGGYLHFDEHKHQDRNLFLESHILTITASETSKMLQHERYRRDVNAAVSCNCFNSIALLLCLHDRVIRPKISTLTR